MIAPWILTEPVDVTAVTPNMVLIARTAGPGAVTVEATEDGELLISGRPETLDHHDLYQLTTLADAVLVGHPQIGRPGRYDLAHH